jgi:hypothetical protein
VHELSDSVFLNSSKEIESSSSVTFEEWFRVRDASINVSLRCKVHNNVRILQTPTGTGIVSKVSFQEPVVQVSFEVSDVRRIASRPSAVQIGDSQVGTGPNHVMNEIAPDETQTSRNDQIIQSNFQPE